jgi:hypothetical protein
MILPSPSHRKHFATHEFVFFGLSFFPSQKIGGAKSELLGGLH